MRLIDADKIKYEEYLQGSGNGQYREINIVTESDIDTMPTIDPKTLPIVQELQKERNKLIAEMSVKNLNDIQQSFEIEQLRKRLEEITVERDRAISDMEALMWYSGEGCNICEHCVQVQKEPYVKLECGLGKGVECRPKWRGI